MMRIFHGFDALPRFERAVATVGSFDGVHRGHLALLRTVIGQARAGGGESVVLTFEPHPRITLGHAEGLRLLTTLEEKACLLERAGIDNLVVIPFDRAFSRLSSEQFVGEYLVGKVGVRTLVAGFDHRFGHDRTGVFARIAEGVQLIEVPECVVDGEKVSSTAIRRLIALGDLRRAEMLLGHPYLLIGRAEQSRRCPDESLIRLHEPLKLLPPSGEYEVSIAGKHCRLTIDKENRLILHDAHHDRGEVPLEFLHTVMQLRP